MFNFFGLLKRFLPPYKKYVLLSLLMNFISTVFSLFSFVAIIPILNILFGITKSTTQYIPWSFSDSLSSIAFAIKNNLMFEVENIINTSGQSKSLLFLGLFLIFMTALKVGTSFLASYYLVPIRTGVVKDLRNKLYNKILNLPLGYFTEERKGDIISRISGDVNEIEVSIMSSLDMVIKNPVIILIYLIVLFTMSWQLTLFVLLLLPVSGWLIGRIGRSLKRKSNAVQEQTGELISQIEETLGGLRVVKAFNAENKLQERFSLLNEKIRKTFSRIHNRFNLAHPISELMGTAVIAVLLWFGGVLILSNNAPISASGFIFYLVIFYSIINPSKDLSKATYSIQKGLASLARVDKILLSENTIQEPENPEQLISFIDKIEYRNVSFRYQTDWVLRNINLTIRKGKTVAFVGQSGSGKSTLVDLVPRFYDVEEGEILIDGKNVKHLNTKDIRALIGNVNQEAILFNDTFYNNITFGVENATMEQVIEAAKIANAHDFIIATENGYNTNIGDRGNKLSGGQRQRVSIARAILKNPPILILDEATSALDTESERLVQEALDNLMRNRTTLVIAHRLSTVVNADEIYVLHEGQIVEHGKHRELINQNGVYNKLYEMQSF